MYKSNINYVVLLMILMTIIMIISLKSLSLQFSLNSVSEGYVWMCWGYLFF